MPTMNHGLRCLVATHSPPPLPTMATTTSSSLSIDSSQSNYTSDCNTSLGVETDCNDNGNGNGELEIDDQGISASKSKSNTRTATTRASVKKHNMKCLCAKCGGDVRLPPLPKSTSSGTIPSITDTCVGRVIETDIASDSGSHASEPFVECALECSSSRYHLSCSGVPPGSQIYRSIVLSNQPSSDNSDAHEDTTHYSLETSWWELSPDSMKRRSYQSLQNDKEWSASRLAFICPNCDVEGTSRYLAEYFEKFHSMKKAFYTRYLSEVREQNLSHRLNSAEESVEARTGEAFLWYLMQATRNEQLRHQQTTENMTLGEDKFHPSELKFKNMGFVHANLSKQLQRKQVQHHQGQQKRQKVTLFGLDPSYLIGMPLRLFNPIDNSYHTGRILDYKVDALHKVDEPISGSDQPEHSAKFPVPNIGELTDENISRKLYLVRFRQGMEGRKIAVHEWIYLEEHAVAIGGEICWANVGSHSNNATGDGSTHERNEDEDKVNNMIAKGDLSSYRPAQIMFRSMLEMIPVQNLNPSSSCDGSKNSCTDLNVLALGFGQAFSHIRLNLRNSDFNANEESALTIDTGMDTEEQATPQAIPLTTSLPAWIAQILQRAELTDDDVGLGLAMALMEKEEERRVRARARHYLQLSRPI